MQQSVATYLVVPVSFDRSSLVRKWTINPCFVFSSYARRGKICNSHSSGNSRHSKEMLNGGWRIPDQQLVKLVLSQGGGGTWRAEKMWVVLGGAYYLLPTTYPALEPSCCCLVWPILSSVATLTIEPPTCIAECYVFILLLYRNYARKGAFTKSSAPQHLIIFGPLWLHI